MLIIGIIVRAKGIKNVPVLEVEGPAPHKLLGIRVVLLHTEAVFTERLLERSVGLNSGLFTSTSLLKFAFMLKSFKYEFLKESLTKN